MKKIAILESKLEELQKDLIHDAKTRLKTRAFFEEEVKKHLAIIYRVARSGRKELFGFKNLSILFLDIDHFKKVNDTYGHDAGDQVLRIVSKTIVESVRIGDTAARWGGEEIVVSLLGANEDEAKYKAEDIRKKVETLSFGFDPNFRLTISIGVVHAEVGVPYEELFNRVDKSMYHAKETGRNKVVAYSELGE